MPYRWEINNAFEMIHNVLCVCQPWPEEALERVANTFLKTLEMSEHERNQVMPICKTFHTSAIQLSHK